jgi:truncated hemoglobin YjbI
MAGTFRKCTAFGKRFCSRNTLQEALPPHQLPIAKEHFDRWMEIFTSTTDELFAGATAEEAKLRAIWQKCSITKLTI